MIDYHVHLWPHAPYPPLQASVDQLAGYCARFPARDLRIVLSPVQPADTYQDPRELAEEEARIREWLRENQQETGEDSSAPSEP